MFKKLLSVLGVTITLVVAAMVYHQPSSKMPVVAIANYGPHASLDQAILGVQSALEANGFKSGENIKYVLKDVGFDSALVPQMVSSLKMHQPKVFVALTTPVALVAKNRINDIPVIYSVITDPVDAGLLKEAHQVSGQVTGSSDQQDLNAFLGFARQMLPKAKRVGMLYASAEKNDVALLKRMTASTQSKHMTLVALPVDQARDVPLRMQQFKHQVDFIYVGASGPIQPTLPVIAKIANDYHIPLFNVESQAVQDGLVMASFGVDYFTVGQKAGQMIANYLRGQPLSNQLPSYPTAKDHHAVINVKIAQSFGAHIPANSELVGGSI